MGPRVVVSRCLGFEACRYNGEMVESMEVNALRGRVEFITVCPEAEAGLGTPRRPINLQEREGKVRVIQAVTGDDLTEALRSVVEAELGCLGDVDAFVLKARSPSCGLGTAVIWDADGANVVRLGSGVFASEARRRYPSSVFLDEEALSRMGVEGFLRLLEA